MLFPWPMRRRSYRSRSRSHSRSRSSNASLLSLALALCCCFCSSLLLLPLPALASPGDRSPEFQHCVQSCRADVCGPFPEDYMSKDGDGVVSPKRLPLILRATRWTCPDDCAYHCTHRITNDAHARVADIKRAAKNDVWADVSRAIQSGGRGASRKEINDRIAARVQAALSQLRPVQKQMVQYYGKWVFVRVLGAQEPLSVLFSVMNLLVHLRYISRLREKVPDVFPLKLVYLVHALISVNAWTWSAIFHTRDKPLTEKLDYFSAGATILSGFFFTIARLFRLAPGDARFNLILKVCAGCLTLHILYLSLASRFDYSYNIAVNVLLAIVHNLLWLVYSLTPRLFPDGSSDPYRATRAALRASKPSSSGLSTPVGVGGSPPAPVSAKAHIPSTSKKPRRRLRLIVLLLTSAAALELLDFPPLLRALDAHALWHLATVPIAAMWYDWLIDDAQECVSSGFWIGESLLHPLLSSLRETVGARVGVGMGMGMRARSVSGDADADEQDTGVAGALQRASTWARRRAAASPLRPGMGSIELSALTDSLSALAGKAGFSAAGRSGGGGGGAGASTGTGAGSTLGMGLVGARDSNEEGTAADGLTSISTLSPPGSATFSAASSSGKEREKTSDELEERIGL